MSDHIVGRIEFYGGDDSPYRAARALKLLQMLESGKLEMLAGHAGIQPHIAKRFTQDIKTELQDVTGE